MAIATQKRGLSTRVVYSICVGLALLTGVSLPAHHDDEARRNSPMASVMDRSISFHQTGILIADGSNACLWDVETGRQLQRFTGHTEAVRAVAFSRDGNRVLTGGGRETDLGSFSTDNSARLWDVVTGKEIQRFEGHNGFVHTVQFSPNGKRVLTAARDSTARLWDTATGRELFVFSNVSYAHPTVTFNYDGQTILGLAAGGHRVMLWNAQTGNVLVTIERGNGFYESATFNHTGEIILTASSDGTVRAWAAQSGQQLTQFSGHTGTVHQATFTADDHSVVTASADGTVRFWDAESGHELTQIQYPGPVQRIIVSGNGKRILAKWNSQRGNRVEKGFTMTAVESGRDILQLTDESASRRVVGLSPDGTKVLIVEGGSPFSLWDSETGEIIRRYK